MENFKSYASALNSTIGFSLNKENIERIYKKYSEPVEAQYTFDILEKIYSNLKKLQSEQDINDKLMKLNMNVNAFNDETFEEKREELIDGKKWLKENNNNITSFIEAIKKVDKLFWEAGGIISGGE